MTVRRPHPTTTQATYSDAIAEIDRWISGAGEDTVPRLVSILKLARAGVAHRAARSVLLDAIFAALPDAHESMGPDDDLMHDLEAAIVVVARGGALAA